MELADYVTVLRKYWRSVTAVALIAVVVAALFSLLTRPTYTSVSTLFFSIKSASNVGELNAGSTYVEGQVQSFAKVAASPIVLQPVIDALGLGVTPEHLAKSITTTVPTRTATLDIAVVDRSPERSARITAAISDRLIAAVRELSPPGADGTEPVLATVIRPATVPAKPTSPRVAQNLGLGLLLGLMFGAGQAVLRSMLDQRIATERDIAQVTQLPVLGAIVASEDDGHSPPLVMNGDPQSLRAEAYRRLRTNLHFLGIGEGERVFLVTSSTSGEGKTTTSINLASTLAAAGERVLLIDADLRRPTVARSLMLEGSVGLSSVLIGEASLDEVVQPVGTSGLEVLASGPIPPNPAELLGFADMARLLEDAKQRYDAVIIDSPPLLPVTDAAVLSQAVSGTLVVAASGGVKAPELARSLGSLEQLDARVLGVVLNRVRAQSSEQESYRYRYHAHGGSDARQGRDSSRPRRSPSVEEAV